MSCHSTFLTFGRRKLRSLSLWVVPDGLDMNAKEALALPDNWPSNEEAVEEEILDLGLNRDAESLLPCASDEDIADRLSTGKNSW